MREIAFVVGDATRPSGAGTIVIAHICNDEGYWRDGFLLALSKRWKAPEHRYRESFQSSQRPKLGDVQIVQVQPELFIASIIGRRGIRSNPFGEAPIRYEAVENGLAQLSSFVQERKASVHMPRIGCSLAGGEWEEIEPLILRTLSDADVDVTVYDYVS